jgi:outer membrane protein assembly factor BamD
LRRFALLLMCAIMLASASQCTGQIFHKKKKVDKSTDVTNTVEPDKQLYDKAMADIKRGKHEVGRLSLQTLINTYPDSEYLAKAKLAIADSYYKEGGNANITQAINGYKDFIVFFPFLPEAAYAQMQVAMANYNEMAKPDRDATHAKAAEEEFQTFLLKYPKDPLAPQAEQRLREVQEVLAEGQFRIAYYYYLKGDRRAAAGRLIPLVRRYPLYSKSDDSLWMLGEIFEKSERKDLAGVYYAQIVKNYPLSDHASGAKGKLKDFGMPIPQPDPKALAWMRAEQNAPRPKESLVHRSFGMLHSGPDVHTAALQGQPNMQPDDDQGSGDILAGGNRSTMGTGGTTGIVATVKPGEAAPAGTPAGSTATEDVNSNGGDPATGAAGETSTDPQTGTTGTTSSEGTAANGTAPDGSSTADNPKADNTQPTTGTASQPQNQKESSSKKKGLKKILPW